MIYKSFGILLLFFCIGSTLKTPSYLPWKYGTCLTPGVKQYFEIEKFFKGTWYEERSFGNYLYQGDGWCSSMKSNISSDGTITVLNYHYEPLLGTYLYVRGTSSTKLMIAHLARIPLHYELLNGLIKVDIPFYIVDTDYDNWALIYMCDQHLLHKAEMSWILTRKRGSTKYDKETKAAVAKALLDYDEFIIQKNTDCPPEPEL